MDGGEQGQWRTISFSGGVLNKAITNTITPGFRPIAPKPANAGFSLTNNGISLVGSKRRIKRKYARVSKSCTGINRKRGNKKASDQEKKDKITEGGGSSNEVVTLQLFPEAGDLKQPLVQPQERVSDNNISGCNFVFLGTKDGQDNQVPPGVEEGVVVESWVTVELVTDTYYKCMDGVQVWRASSRHTADHADEDRGSSAGYFSHDSMGQKIADAEKVGLLELDTCPVFVTDGGNNVRWVNGAYKRMVAGDRRLLGDVMVRLMIKEEWLPSVNSNSCCGFSCWVRLKYTWREGKGEGHSRVIVVPCDAWRMMGCGGGFAWRLDLEAALRLGR